MGLFHHKRHRHNSNYENGQQQEHPEPPFGHQNGRQVVKSIGYATEDTIKAVKDFVKDDGQAISQKAQETLGYADSLLISLEKNLLPILRVVAVAFILGAISLAGIFVVLLIK